MSATENLTAPVEIDTRLAELYGQRALTRHAIASHEQTILHAAGAQYYYRGRRRVTNMKLDEALAIVTPKLEAGEYLLRGYMRDSVQRAIDGLESENAKLREINDERKALDNKYTGWSRFYVVTSSNGHIHSSMHCSTCRPTTTFGWMPDLSSKSMAEAIEFFGPAATALCSVCFPDAPVARLDDNLTAKQRDDLLAGRTPTAQSKKEYCPGSGQTPVNRRSGYRYGTCPHCGYVGAVTQSGQMRKHKEQKQAVRQA